MAKRDIIGIGGSAGSTPVLQAILASLPPDAALTVFVTTHIGVGRRQYLRDVLARVTPLPVRVVEDGEPVVPGRIYLAAPDAHLLVTRQGIRLGRGPRENMVRPSIDPMLRSLAMIYGPRVIGVIVSGALNDGASGLCAVKQCGGLAVVQNPQDAEVPDMPTAATEAVDADHIADAAALGPLLEALSLTDAPEAPVCPPEVRLEVEIASGGRLGSERLKNVADPAAITCPHCHGVLSEVRDGRPLRYRCQVGHAMTAEVLDRVQDDETEEALRVALRVMEERAELVDRMARDARRQGRTAVAELYERREREYAAHADTLRKAVLAGLAPIMEDDGETGEADSAMPPAKSA